jgi:hypothetical protein
MTKTVGFIGKNLVNSEEEKTLRYMGKLIGRAGRGLVTTATKGAALAVEEGVKLENGNVKHVKLGVMGVSDYTLIYADDNLLTRLEKDPGFDKRENVYVMLTLPQLMEWNEVAKQVLKEKSIEPPKE